MTENEFQTLKKKIQNWKQVNEEVGKDKMNSFFNIAQLLINKQADNPERNDTMNQTSFNPSKDSVVYSSEASPLKIEKPMK